MAAMLIYGKKPFKNFLQNQKADDLGICYVALGMWGLPISFKINDDPRLNLTYLMSRSNLLPNAWFTCEIFWKVDFFEYCTR